MGFTLTELIAAVAIGMLTASVAGDLLLSHMRSSERAETIERQRSDWSRTTGFIEAEVALSERAIGDQANIAIPASCGITAAEFRLALDLRRDLPPVIYAVRSSQPGWIGANTLWRCGPSLNDDGSYNSTPSMAPLLDGLDGSTSNGAGGGFSATPSSDGKQVGFTLSLKGHARISYQQDDAARTRIAPLYGRPTENSLCEASNMVRLSGSPNLADTLTMAIAQVQLGEDVLICGFGNGTSAQGVQGDVITGSTANDILECGDYGLCTLNGLAGNDVLRGTNEADTLKGDDPSKTNEFGNDTLIGRAGNDSLNGGGGQNSYLPGAGNDSITGGSGLDIVFFSGNRNSYSLSNCTKTACTVTSSAEGSDTLQNVEILIFKDARYDIPD